MSNEIQQVVLDEGVCEEELCVTLYEARPGDPAVPRGKAFATISSQELGLPQASQAACGSQIPLRTCSISSATIDHHFGQHLLHRTRQPACFLPGTASLPTPSPAEVPTQWHLGANSGW